MIRRAVHAACAAAFALPCVSAQTIERISVAENGDPQNVMQSSLTAPSADGRFVAFSTTASNLHPGDVPLTMDLFLRDRRQSKTIPIAPDGIVDGLSQDGRFVSYTLFEKLPGPWRWYAHVLDRATNTDTALTSGPDQSYGGPLSGDGRYVAYTRHTQPSTYPLVTWRRELATGQEELVSGTLAGAPNANQALPNAISRDGSIVTFTSADPDLVHGDVNGAFDAFYRDFAFGFTDRLSVAFTGLELTRPSEARAVTPDTRFFLFSSLAPDVVPDDTNDAWDLFVHDRYLGEVRRVSVDSNGAQGQGPTRPAVAWISDDGERVIFDSQATNLVAGDTNGATDVFERDLATGETRRIVLGIGGAQPDAHVYFHGASPDGRFLTVSSLAGNLVSQPNGGVAQVYLVDRGPQCYVTGFCTSLPNSTGSRAVISAFGDPSLSAGNLVLYCLDLPDSATCVFFHGTTRLDPPLPIGEGLLCAGGTRVRCGLLQASGGAVIQFQDPASAAYAAVSPGAVRRFQLLYRDPSGGVAGFNTSDALEVTFCP